MSKASREWKERIKESNRNMKGFSSWCYESKKNQTLKGYKKYKRRRKKFDKVYKKRDSNFYSLYHGDMNFKNSMDEESAMLMEDLRVY